MLVLPALAAVALGGCSSTESTSKISKENLQQSATQALEQKVGQRPEKFDCPGDIDAKVGTTTRCVLSDKTTRYGVAVTVTSVEGSNFKLDVQVDQAPMQ